MDQRRRLLAQITHSAYQKQLADLECNPAAYQKAAKNGPKQQRVTPRMTEDDEKAIKEAESRARMVLELKKAKVPQPPEISNADWAGPRKLRNRTDLVCFYAAHGLTNKRIAEAMNYSPTRVATIVNSELGRLRAKQIKAEYFSKETTANLDRMLPKALINLESALDNKLSGLKAEKVLDASLWLIKQRTGDGEEKAGTIGSLLRTLEEIRKAGDSVTKLTKAQIELRKVEGEDQTEIINVNPNLAPAVEHRAPDEDDAITQWVDQAIPVQAGKEGK